MAPDRGVLDSSQRAARHHDESDLTHDAGSSIAEESESAGQEPDIGFLAEQRAQPQFTFRACMLGAVVGVLIAFSNTYFGLQTGWISGMAMPSALIGFAYFKGLRAFASRLGEPFKQLGFGEGFSEAENVLVQAVAGSVGTMPLGCGFVGVIPALEFLLKPSEAPETPISDPDVIAALASAEALGGIRLPLGKLILWALGLCFFGVVLAVPLRREVILREKLKFPSGTATALMIGVLHGGERTGIEGNIERLAARRRKRTNSDVDDEERHALIGSSGLPSITHRASQDEEQAIVLDKQNASMRDWKKQIHLLTMSFSISGLYTLVSYFIPQLHSIPIFGTYMANMWLWDLNPSPAYVGQGVIMGPATTLHMLFGALLGWAVLSPVAKHSGWASGSVSDWNTGSKGWIVWVSLAIMLADAIVNLCWLVVRTLYRYWAVHGPRTTEQIRQKGLSRYLLEMFPCAMRHPQYFRNISSYSNDSSWKATSETTDTEEHYGVPPEHQIGQKTTVIGAVFTLGFCVVAVHYSFMGIISIKLILLSIVLALLLSIMGVRALGETDINPVSGISKLTQLVFALVTPTGSRNAVVINIIAGGISEAGALQAGDLLQDLKTGHLLGASPKAQFYGQLIGSGIGAIASACVYKLYTRVYTIPGGIFQVPTGYVWIFTARLVTGQGLPPRAAEFAVGAAILWTLFTALRIYGNIKRARWVPYIPGGIAVAVGMYNTPSFTLARTVGGLMVWYWTSWKKKPETPVIVVASGLILGEGLLSILNLGLASSRVPHL